MEASAESRAAQYDRVYAVIARDPLALDLHRQALGAEYPEGIDVTGGCTRGTLERALAGLRLRPGSLLIDLGCGRGGPGRWLARASGARVLGIDISQVAVGAAADAAEAFLRAGQYGYLRGTFDATGLPDGCADGVVAIEALGMAPDRGKAVAEVRRILRPGGRASITGAERHGPGKAAPGEAAPGKTAPGDGASSQTPSSQTSSGDASSGDVFRWAPLVGAAGLTWSVATWTRPGVRGGWPSAPCGWSTRRSSAAGSATRPRTSSRTPGTRRPPGGSPAWSASSS